MSNASRGRRHRRNCGSGPFRSFCERLAASPEASSSLLLSTSSETKEVLTGKPCERRLAQRGLCRVRRRRIRRVATRCRLSTERPRPPVFVQAGRSPFSHSSVDSLVPCV
ncbi:hypothetical protein MRX96_026896 [Rhipicephalus microplus]